MLSGESGTLRVIELLKKHEITGKEEIEKIEAQVLSFNRKTDTPVCLLLAEENRISESDIAKLFYNTSLYSMTKEMLSKDETLRDKDISQYLSENDNAVRLLSRLVNDEIISIERKKNILEEILNSREAAIILARDKDISEESIASAFMKKRSRLSFCEAIYKERIVTLSELNLIFREMDETLKLGNILLNLDLIDEAELDETLAEQSESSASLGSILLKKNKISVHQLYFALSIQYNIPFRPLSDFIYSDSQKIELRNIIDRKTAEDHLIIPILLTGETLMLGLFNPPDAANINDIISNTGNIKISCVLVTNNKFEQLYSLLYGEFLKTSNMILGQKTNDLVPEKKTVISDPGSQYRVINDLFERYMGIIKKMGGNGSNASRNVFHEFIRENYFKISSQYKCDNVAFWFDTSDDDVRIMASPVFFKKAGSN